MWYVPNTVKMYLYFVLAVPFLKIYPFGNNKQKKLLFQMKVFVLTYREIRSHRDSKNGKMIMIVAVYAKEDKRAAAIRTMGAKKMSCKWREQIVLDMQI